MTEAERERWEERAAIGEFDGGLTREAAEQQATEIERKRNANDD